MPPALENHRCAYRKGWGEFEIVTLVHHWPRATSGPRCSMTPWCEAPHTGALPMCACEIQVHTESKVGPARHDMTTLATKQDERSTVAQPAGPTGAHYRATLKSEMAPSSPKCAILSMGSEVCCFSPEYRYCTPPPLRLAARVDRPQCRSSVAVPASRLPHVYVGHPV